jgi:predicted metal-dependent peptidase
MNIENGIKKASRAVLDVCLDYPFYGGILMSMDLIVDEKAQTAWTDGRNIGFNPLFFDELTPYGARFVIIHETMHIMLKHHLRKGTRDHGRFNRAADYVIHCNMKADNLRILDWVLYDAKFDNMTTETVYKLLPDDPKDDKHGDGSGESGTTSGDKPQTPGTSGLGEVRPMKNEDGSTMSEAEKAEAAREVDIAVAQAINQARAAGKGTAGQERFCKEILEPKVDWRTELRMYLEQFAKDDYSWQRPNRRYCSYGLYLPTLKSESMPDMVFFLDTSCSVSNQELKQFIAEVSSILSIFKVQVHVVYVDTRVHNPQCFNSDEHFDPTEFRPAGFGGTCFRPGFEWVEEQGIEPAVAVYLTDLDCSTFPNDEPPYPVLWVNTNAYNNDRILPFGNIINLDSFD